MNQNQIPEEQQQPTENQGPNTVNNNNHNKNNSRGIKSLDILGNKFSLTFPTSSGKFQTSLGGYITIAMTIVGLGISLVVLSQYFRKDAPVVTASSEFGSQITEFNLYDEDLYSPIGMGLGPTVLIPAKEMPKYVTLVAMIAQNYYDHIKQIQVYNAPQYIDFVDCESQSDPKVQKVLNEIVKDNGLKQMMSCPDFGKVSSTDFYVKTNLTMHLYRSIRIVVYPCSLPDRSQCAQVEDLDQIRVDFGKRERFVDASDYDNPVRDQVSDQQIRIEKGVFKWINIEAKQNKVLDDTVQFIKPKIRAEYATIDFTSSDFENRDPNQIYCTKAEIFSGACKPLVSLNYVAGGEVSVIRRNYKSITTVLGEIGGILKVLTTLVFFLYSFYNFRKVKSYLGLKMLGMSRERFEELKKLEKEQQDAEESEFLSKSDQTESETKSKGKKGKEKGVSLDKAMKDLLKSRSEIIDLMEKLDSVEIIENALFTDSEKRLIPLALLAQKRNEIIRKMDENLDEKNRKKNGRKIYPQSRESQKKGGKKRASSSGDSLEESYQTLLETEPNSHLKKRVREFMLKNLEGLPLKPLSKVRVGSRNFDQVQNDLDAFVGESQPSGQSGENEGVKNNEKF